jgi:hypothetical protein
VIDLKSNLAAGDIAMRAPISPHLCRLRRLLRNLYLNASRAKRTRIHVYLRLDH